MYSAFAGEGYAEALARIIAGVSEPSGRLAETFPLCLEHTPSFFNFTPSFTEMASVTFGEGLLTGYRWYDTRKLPTLFPFGHGLSYTTFAYTDFALDKTEMSADDICTARITVKNTGERTGSTVLQLYIHEHGGHYARPQKELKDFAKVTLKAGEEKSVSFTISREELELYSDTLHRWGVQADSYDIIIGTSAAQTAALGTLTITSGDKMRILTRESPLVQFVKCAAFHEYLKEHKAEWLQHFFCLEETDFLVFMLPLPFYRLSERVQGEPMFTSEEIDEVVSFCNAHS